MGCLRHSKVDQADSFAVEGRALLRRHDRAAPDETVRFETLRVGVR